MDELKTQKFGDAVTPMGHEIHKNLQLVIGDLTATIGGNPWKPFDNRTVAFLSDVSKFLLIDSNSRKLPDLVSFAYWCRLSNIDQLKKKSGEIDALIGRGTVFHIPTTNVPLNFAYSLVTGLLAGNTNIVRVPNLESIEVQQVIHALKSILLKSEHSELMDRVCIVRYGHIDEITQYFSEHTNARVIWGGDSAVRHIRSVPTNPRSIDISFADRISIALIKSSAVNGASDNELIKIAEHFYVDGYTFNQNACSSPRRVVWDGTEVENKLAASLFWKAVSRVALTRAEVEPVHVMNRLVETCENLSKNKNIKSVDGLFEAAVRLELIDETLWEETSSLRFGTFTQRSISKIQEVKDILNQRVQTISYFGYSKLEFEVPEIKMILQSVDRVVPFGQALTFELIWDGYDLIRCLSRRVVIR